MTCKPTAHSPQLTAAASPLRGWVNTYYRHYKGKKLGPYYVRRWKVGRKVYREYIKPEDVDRVRAACQAHREGRTRISRFLDNFDFLGKMMDRFDTGRVVTPAMEDYIRRIHSEGPYITGRPQMRRKVKRTLATIDGKEIIVKTIFELDGTTKTFMVPFFLNFGELHPSSCRDGSYAGGGGVGPAAAWRRLIQGWLDIHAAAHRSGGGGSLIRLIPDHPNTQPSTLIPSL